MRRLAIIIILIVALTLCYACTPQVAAPGPSPAPAPAPAPAPVPAPKPAPAPTPATAPAEKPKSGGILHYPLMYLPSNFDTHRQASYSPFIGLLVFNNLLQFDVDKANCDPANIVGDLAERWQTSADGLAYTFYLRKGVTWHDGKPFTADDVVYSLTKLMDPTRSTALSYMEGVKAVERIGDYEVRVRMDAPSAAFLVMMTQAYTAIQPRHLAGTDGRSSKFLIGTGPFKFKSMVSGVNMEFERNPNYFKKDQLGNQLPYLDGVVTYVMADKAAQVAALATGKLDMLNPGTAVYASSTVSDIKKAAKDAVIEYATKPVGNVLWFNHARKPFDDIRVRKAAAMVMDRGGLVIAGYGAKEWGNYEHAFFPPPYGLATAEILKLTGQDKALDARVAEAKRLLAEAGYPSGIKGLEILGDNVKASEQRATFLADTMRKTLNIEAKLSLYEKQESWDRRDAGKFDLHVRDYPILVGELNEYMPYFRGDSPSNFVGYKNPAVDKLWIAQARELDKDKRAKMGQEIERNLLQDMTAMPIDFMVYGQTWLPYVKGYKMFAVSYQANTAFEKVWLAK